MPQVVRVDNFARDYKRPHVVATGLSEADAIALCNKKRQSCTATGPDWYVVKPDSFTISDIEDFPGFEVKE